MNKNAYWQPILAVALMAGTVAPVFAGEGGIDSSFGLQNGVSEANFLPETHGSGAQAACLDPTGRILTFSRAGHVAGEPAPSYGVMRFTADGVPDDSFSFDGRMRLLPESSVFSHLWSMACQENGSAIVGAFVHGAGLEMVTELYRITADGELDPEFGDGGALTLDTAYQVTEGTVISALPDGRIAVAGAAYNPNQPSRLFLAVADGDGHLQESFGFGGYAYVVTDNDAATDETVNALTIDPDGRFLLAGSAFSAPGNRSMAVWRRLPSGLADSNFHADGVAMIDFDYGGIRADEATWIQLRRNGRIAVGGRSAQGTSMNIAIAQLLPDGQIDNGFSEDGQITISTFWNGFNTTAVDARLMESGALVVAGAVGNFDAGVGAMLATRFDADGNLDVNFGIDGFSIKPLPHGQHNAAIAQQMLVQPKRYVLAGLAYSEDALDPNETAAETSLVGLMRDEIFADAHEGHGPRN